MGERNQENVKQESLEDIFDPVIGEMTEQELGDIAPLSSDKLLLAEKRRRAEQRLEERRMRDELGCYDMDFDDF